MHQLFLTNVPGLVRNELIIMQGGYELLANQVKLSDSMYFFLLGRPL